MGEFGVVGPDGAAVGDEERWIFFAGGVIERLVEVARDRSGVFTFEVDVFAVGELELGEEGVVDVGELGVLVALDLKKLIGAVDGGDLSDDGIDRAGADGIAVDGAGAGVLSGGHVGDYSGVRDSARFEMNRLED